MRFSFAPRRGVLAPHGAIRVHPRHPRFNSVPGQIRAANRNREKQIPAFGENDGGEK